MKVIDVDDKTKKEETNKKSTKNHAVQRSKILMRMKLQSKSIKWTRKDRK